jgi:DNA-binding XRE family transcriptional regulator
MELRALEGLSVDTSPNLSFFDLTRWRRRPPKSAALRPETIGDRLRARRLQLGLSMEALGRKTGGHRGTIYRLERGRQKPSAKLRLKLQLALASQIHPDF